LLGFPFFSMSELQRIGQPWVVAVTQFHQHGCGLQNVTPVTQREAELEPGGTHPLSVRVIGHGGVVAQQELGADLDGALHDRRSLVRWDGNQRLHGFGSAPGTGLPLVDAASKAWTGRA